MIAPRFLPLGDSAMTVEFGDRIDPALMAAVAALDHSLAAAPVDGMIEAVPTYRSLTVHYDPLRCSFDRLAAHIRTCLNSDHAQDTRATYWRVPVCYEAPYALDKDEYQANVGLPFDEAVSLHQQAVFTIAMFGFMPGCAYLAGLPEPLHLPRRTTPRAEVPAGSVMIGGQQALISSVPMPTGWYVIGRTPLPIFNADADPVTPFKVGDKISFTAISAADWDSAQLDVTEGAD